MSGAFSSSGEPACSGREASRSPGPSSVSRRCQLSGRRPARMAAPLEDTDLSATAGRDASGSAPGPPPAPRRGGERGETLGEAPPTLSVVAQLVERNLQRSELCGDAVAIGRPVESAVPFLFKLFDLFLQAGDMPRQDGSRRLGSGGNQRPHRRWDQGGHRWGHEGAYPRVLNIRAERRCGRGRHCRDCGATAGAEQGCGRCRRRCRAWQPAPRRSCIARRTSFGRLRTWQGSVPPSMAPYR